ncbi:hypothetical protein K466DRAFT_668053 [Polyporus arcularius HHB13444]|uniref:Uncharacterized protein n=1 Tax=Polyporus arcularius HHB13444 TaxID=1314778 RepID=A0A5C3NPY0_9APHY|nr:hypothetical protein K466DRAFT_668053 [Polyporus arcularius HHB13444]
MARRRPGPAVGKTKKGWYNYTTKASADRGLLREVIDMDIVDKTGDPGAGMRWEALAFQELVVFYGIILRGWPPRVIFQNPSDMPIADIRYLLELFEFGFLYFRRATPGELFAARESIYNAVPCLLFELPATRNCRSNLNQHWARPTIDPVKFPPRFVRNGPKSARGVDSDSEDEEESGVSEIEDADEYWGPVAPLKKRYHELEEDPITQF